MEKVKKENVLKAILVSLLFPVIYLVVMVLVNLVSQLFYMVVLGFTQEAYEAAGNVILLASAAVFFLVTFIIFKTRHQSLLKRIQWNPAPKKSVYAFAALLTLGIFLVTVMVQLVLIPQSWMANDTQINDTQINNVSGLSLIWTIAIGGIIIPIAEETAFRGLMMTHLQERVAPWLAVAMTALVFSVVHITDSFGHMFVALPAAVVLSLVFLWTRSIRATMTMHILYNSVPSIIASITAGASDSTSSDDSSSTLTLIIMGLIGLAITVVMLYLIYKRRVKAAPEFQSEV